MEIKSSQNIKNCCPYKGFEENKKWVAVDELLVKLDAALEECRYGGEHGNLIDLIDEVKQ